MKNFINKNPNRTIHKEVQYMSKEHLKYTDEIDRLFNHTEFNNLNNLMEDEEHFNNLLELKKELVEVILNSKYLEDKLEIYKGSVLNGK